MDVNVTGALNLLEAAKTAQIEQFVLASTSSVYGKTTILPFVETDTADRPLAAYPASKRAAELLAYTYHNLVGMQVTALRFFNVYGPAGRPDMMPWRLMEATRTGEEIKLFNGGDIHRDWTYIADTVNGVLAALDRPLGYEIINLGCGAPISLTDFVEIIQANAGKRINTVSVPTPLSDPPITFCDNRKARELLGFSPAVSVSRRGSSTPGNGIAHFAACSPFGAYAPFAAGRRRPPQHPPPRSLAAGHNSVVERHNTWILAINTLHSVA